VVLKVVILIVISELWNAAGQILYKKGLNELTSVSFATLRGITDFLKYVFGHPYVWLGIGSMVVCIAFWVAALAQADLSFVYPVGSVQYVFVMISAHFLLGEKIDWRKMMGTALVVGGVILISLT
jgi:drug/metabolite transporter (DMT)-like permease